MTTARRMSIALLAALGGALIPEAGVSQVSLQGRAEIGRFEHRVRQADSVAPSSGVVLGSALGLVVADRFEVWGEARGGRLAADSPDGEDRDFAEVQLLGNATVRPWLAVQGAATARTYSTSLARQRWTMLRLGAQARVPLALEGVHGIVRGHWMPVVTVSGLPRPDVALTAGAGVEWRGSRLGFTVLYTFERYDFPGSPASQRLEEVSSLQLRGMVRLHTRRATGRI